MIIQVIFVVIYSADNNELGLSNVTARFLVPATISGRNNFKEDTKMSKSKKKAITDTAQLDRPLIQGTPPLMLPDSQMKESEVRLLMYRFKELVDLHEQYSKLYHKYPRPAHNQEYFVFSIYSDEIPVSNEQSRKICEDIWNNAQKGEGRNTCIRLEKREQYWKGEMLPLKNIMIAYRRMGGDNERYFYMQADDFIQTSIYIDGDRKKPRAFIADMPEDYSLSCDLPYYYFELESFSMLSIQKKDKHGEAGIITVFDKKAGLSQTLHLSVAKPRLQ